VAAVWCAVLGLERVTRAAHFFELGGHSLTAVQMASRLEHALQRTIPVRWVFEAPTLEAFAARLDRAEQSEQGGGRQPPVLPRGSMYARTAPAWIAQSEAWARRERPGNLGHMIVRAFDVRGSVDADALESSLTAIVARHEALRTALVEGRGSVIQRIYPPYRVAVARHDLRHRADATDAADDLFAQEAASPFAFEQPPWVRAALVTWSESRARIVLALPHFVYDGWALDLIYRELETLYAWHLDGHSAHLPAPALQFADYVCWRTQRSSTREEAEVRFWRGRLAGLRSPALPMRRTSAARRLMRQATRLKSVPGFRRAASSGVIARAGVAVRARITNLAGRGAVEQGRLPIVIEPGAVRAMKATAAAAGTTLFTVLLTAFSTVLARVTRRDDVAVATFTTDRERPELEGVVGNLGNTLIIRSCVDLHRRFLETVRLVSEDVISARAHAATPIEMLSQLLIGPGELPINYRVPIAFQLLQGLRRAPRLSGTELISERILGWHRSLRIAVTLHEEGDRVTGTCSFDPDLYDAAGCERLIAAFVAAVTRAAEHPERSLLAIVNSIGDGAA
jgi:hypothetical protein